MHTDLCTHALLVDLVLAHPLLHRYLLGAPGALAAPLATSLDFLCVLPSLSRLA